MICNFILKGFYLVVIAVSFWLSPVANACEGSLKMVGSSSFSVWFWDVYDIELKTTNGTYQEKQYPLELELTYKRDIEKDDLVLETKNQWERFNLDPNDKSRWLDELGSIWPNVKENDRITFRICKSGKTHFYYNDKSIGEIDDLEFGKYFSQIWLNTNGAYPKQTRKLLGLSNKP
jgi:hypothetical protein